MKMKKTVRSQIMDFVERKKFARRRDIVKFIREEIQHTDYDPVRDRGYYSCHLRKKSRTYVPGGWKNTYKWNPGYLMKPSKNDPRYLVQNLEKEYYVTKLPF